MFLKKVSMQPDFLDHIEHVPPDGVLTITSPVGDGFPPRCRNLSADVRKIKAALNRFSPLGVFETRHLLNGLVGIVGLTLGAQAQTELLVS